MRAELFRRARRHRVVEQRDDLAGEAAQAGPATLAAASATFLRRFDAADGHAADAHPVGRNGMHHSNHQDPLMLTAMLVVDNIVNDAGPNGWTVTVEDEAHDETGSSRAPARTVPRGTGRSVPTVAVPALD